MNLLGVPLGDRPAYFAKLMPHILAEKAKTGRPHWLVIDETHHLLPAGEAATNVASLLPDRGLMFVIGSRRQRPSEAALPEHRHTRRHRRPPHRNGDRSSPRALEESIPAHPAIEGDKLPTGDALVWSRGDATAVEIIHTKPPRTERARHLRKYAAGNLGPERSFYFRGPEGKLNLKASKPVHLPATGRRRGRRDVGISPREQGDFSKWAAEQIKDKQLAADLAEVEANKKAGPKDTRASSLARRDRGAVHSSRRRTQRSN